MIEGEVVLVTDSGETRLGPGMAAGFPPATGDGHHLVNRGDRPATLLEIGDRKAGDEGHYSDVDFGPVRVY